MTDLKYNKITISGSVAAGTTTLAKHLQEILGWQYINAGQIQREYDRTHGINENKQGAMSRSDQHEREVDEMTKQLLLKKNNLIYEAWLAGFFAKKIPRVLKILLICSNEAIRIDRIVNRDNIGVDQAKYWLKQREEENIKKWRKLYGPYNFWDPANFDLVIDTFSSGPMETVGRALDKLGYKRKFK